jgi:hypothetical protein
MSDKKAPNNCCAGARVTGLSIIAEARRAPDEQGRKAILHAMRTSLVVSLR